MITQWAEPLSWGVVPLTGMNGGITYFTFWLIWPLLGGMIMVLIMPRILGPLFLKIKGAVWRDYKNAYVDLPHPKLTQKRVLRRSLYLSLLTMGIVSVLIYIIPYELLIPAGVASGANEFHHRSSGTRLGSSTPTRSTGISPRRRSPAYRSARRFDAKSRPWYCSSRQLPIVRPPNEHTRRGARPPTP